MKRIRKVLSFLLVLAIILGTLPVSIFAGSNNQNERKAGNQVRVIVENQTFAKSEGANWEGVLLDTWVSIDDDTNALMAVKKALEDSEYSVTGAETGYITEIGGLSEFDGGSQSGWNGFVNDWCANEGLNNFTIASGKLQNGDEIDIRYSCNWGLDLGSDWSNNDTALGNLSFDQGVLNQVFSKDIKEYTLTLQQNVNEITVTPSAVNKNFQVRVYKNQYTPEQNGTEYKRNDKITVNQGDELYIGVGNAAWPSMNWGATESLYKIKIAYDNNDNENDKITIHFTAQKDGSFLLDPSKQIEVTDGIAEKYGYKMPSTDHQNNVVNAPTVFDALVAAHQEKYGADFTKETAKNYLDINDSGTLTKAFGETAFATGYFVNGTSPNDGIEGKYGTTGYMINAARIVDGDNVELWFYQDTSYWSDYYTQFRESYKKVTAGSEITLSLEGFMAISAMGHEPTLKPVNGKDSITLNAINADGSIGEVLKNSANEDCMIDENGNATLLFNEPGKYMVTANGFENSNSSPIIAPYCMIEVVAGNTDIPDDSNTEINQKVNQMFDATTAYLLQCAVPGISSIGGDWIITGLSRSNQINKEFGEGYYNNVVKQLVANQSAILSKSKSSENSRVILSMTSLGYQINDVYGYNLLTPLSDYKYVTKQGINGPIWALLALDSKEYEIPTCEEDKIQNTRERMIEYILNSQLQNGGFSLDEEQVDTDVTAMAITALAPYQSDNADIKNAIDKAVDALSKLQNEDGSFENYGSKNTESNAQVIIALTTLGIDPVKDERFIKNENTVLDALSKFYVESGFGHTDNKSLNQMSTEQAYLALVAYTRFMNNENPLYQMMDRKSVDNPKVSITVPIKEQVGNSDKSELTSTNHKGNSSNSKDSLPKTGDYTNIYLYVLLMVSGGTVLITSYRRKKYNI